MVLAVSVGLATIGVCVFSAVTSVAAFFILLCDWIRRKTMKNTFDYKEGQHLSDIRDRLEDNLEEFKKKFILFFIGLVGIALSIVLNAFGAMGIASIPMLVFVAAWCGPLVVKFWFSGFGSLFDFQYKEYEIDQYGNKRDVSKIDSVLVGPFMKCMVALVVAVIAFYLVPAEIIVRFLNHIRLESKLGEKGSVTATPRREAILSVIVIVAMIIVGTIGGIVSSVRENTSDMSDGEVSAIISTLQSKSKSYTINSLCSYTSESTQVCGKVVQAGETITLTASYDLKYFSDGKTYIVPAGIYTYTGGKWVDVDTNTALALSGFAIGVAFDLESMKENTDTFVINVEKEVMGGRIDKDVHDCYQLRAKDNSKLQFEDFYIEKDFEFAAWSGQNYIFVFGK